MLERNLILFFHLIYMLFLDGAMTIKTHHGNKTLILASMQILISCALCLSA